MSAKLITVAGEQIAPLDAAGKTIEEAAFAKLAPNEQLSARERGIRTTAIRTERKAWYSALGVTSIEEARELQHLRAENKGLHHRNLRGVFATLLTGAALTLGAVAAATWIMGGFGHDMALTGAAVQASNQRPIQTCTAGDRMPDGHTCGLPGATQ